MKKSKNIHSVSQPESQGNISIFKKAVVFCVLSALFFSGPEVAASLDITDIEGGWTNATGGSNIDIDNVADQGTDTIMWGDGAPPESGYNFTPGVDMIGVALNDNILLGTFNHINVPIPSGTGISSVDYEIGFMTNGQPLSLSTSLMFDHNETSNAPGPPLSDDIVTVTAAALNSQIVAGGDTFFFNLLGFSLDGGLTFSDTFSSPEGGTNTAHLYGIVTAAPMDEVPEPSQYALMLVGAFGLVAAQYRRKRETTCVEK